MSSAWWSNWANKCAPQKSRLIGATFVLDETWLFENLSNVHAKRANVVHREKYSIIQHHNNYVC